MDLRAILTDTLWALVVSDIDKDNTVDCLNTSLRGLELEKAGLKITHAGVLRSSGQITPALFIHNVSPSQIEALIESKPHLVLTPQVLCFKDEQFTVDSSTLEVHEGVVDTSDVKIIPYVRPSTKTVHVGIFSSINLCKLPPNSGAIPLVEGPDGSPRISNCFLYSTNLKGSVQDAQRIMDLCAVRKINVQEQSELLVKEARTGVLTARTKRFRQAIGDIAKRNLRNPLIFGYRYKNKDGNYV